MIAQGVRTLEHLDKSSDFPKLIHAHYRPTHRPKTYSEEGQSHGPNLHQQPKKYLKWANKLWSYQVSFYTR